MNPEQPREQNGRFGSIERGAVVSMMPKKNLEQFRFALQALDREIQESGIPERVKIRAVGGFALLAHGLREDGMTVDIDTVTEAYSRRVRDAINRVASDLHLERDWINNAAAGDSASQTLDMLDAAFLPQDFGLERIDVEVADLPTLTRAKAIAVNDDALSGRTRDWADLVELMDRQGIRSHDEFATAHPGISEWEYPEVHRSVRSWFETGARGEPEVEDIDFDDLDAWLADVA